MDKITNFATENKALRKTIFYAKKVLIRKNFILAFLLALGTLFIILVILKMFVWSEDVAVTLLVKIAIVVTKIIYVIIAIGSVIVATIAKMAQKLGV